MKTITISILLTVLLSVYPSTLNAQTMFGTWEMSQWQYGSSSNPSPVISSTIYSNGDPSVGLTLEASATGVSGLSISGVNNNIINWTLNTTFPSNMEHAYASTLKLALSEAVDFGPAESQQWLPKTVGLGMLMVLPGHQRSEGTITIRLDGGATFSSLGSQTALGQFELSGGGSGFSFLEYSLNPSLSASSTFVLDQLKIDGLVSGIEVEEQFTQAPSPGGTNNTITTLFLGGATTVPEPSGALLVGLTAALSMLRRRRTS